MSLVIFSLKSEAGCIWYGTSSTNKPTGEDYLFRCDTVLMWSHCFWIFHTPGNVHNIPSSWTVFNFSMPKSWQLLKNIWGNTLEINSETLETYWFIYNINLTAWVREGLERFLILALSHLELENWYFARVNWKIQWGGISDWVCQNVSFSSVL